MPTTNLALPFPAAGDPPSGPDAFGALAAAFDTFWGPWTVWTPSVTQLGAVAIVSSDCAYRLVGKMIYVRGTLVVGTGGTAANKVVISGPPSQAAVVAAMPVGFARLYDVSAVTPYRGTLEFDAASTANLVIVLAGGLAGVATFTVALNTNDVISFYGRYPKA